MKLKVLLTSACFLLAFSLITNAQDAPVLKWKVKDPFVRRVFIENKGQFVLPNQNIQSSDISFGASLYGLDYYFTNNAVWIRYNAKVKLTPQEISQLKADNKIPSNLSTADESKFDYKLVPQTHEMNFIGTNPSVQITSGDKVKDYYTYGTSAENAIKANAYKKITYNNIYNGIDIVFYFPEDKQGFEYDVIVHPGADLSQVKIQYPLNQGLTIDGSGNVVIKSAFGDFTDHAPTANELQLQVNKPIACSFTLNKGIVQFNVANYDNSHELKIDPFVKTPIFSLPQGFHVDWDHGSNCYVYGGSPAYKASKYTNQGVLVWTYTESFAETQFIYIGSMAVDRVTQSVYITEGYRDAHTSPGAEITKLNSSGSPIITTAPDPNLEKMWLISFSRCVPHQAVVGGGNVDCNGCNAAYPDAFVLNPSDSSLNAGTITTINVENSANWYDDACLLALDNTAPNPNAFMAMSQSLHASNFNNDLFKLPMPGLTPPSWKVYDNYDFIDAGSVSFGLGNNGAASDPNGFNGAAYGQDPDLFTYDSWVLQKWNAGTGVVALSKTINTPANGNAHMYWGGLTADICDHVFLGSVNTILEYDGGLNNIPGGTYTQAAGDTVYDVSLGNHYILYACGQNFVEAIQENVTFCVAYTAPDTTVKPVTCTTQGSIAITPHEGGTVITYNIQLIDSSTGTLDSTALGVNSTNGVTFHNLGQGLYKAIVTDTSCMAQRITYLFHVTKNVTYSPATESPNPGKMCAGTSVLLTGMNAGALGDYTWLDSATLKKSATLSDSTGTTVTATPVATTTYVMIGRTPGDCPDTVWVKVIVNPLPQIDITPVTPTVCTGSSINLTATLKANNPGTYTWTPATGLNTANGSSVTATPAATTTYTVNTTDANGCLNDTTIVVTVNPYPVINITPTDTQTICTGNSTTLTATGPNGTTYTWAPSNNLSDSTAGASINVSPTSSTTYLVKGTENGCPTPALDTVTVLPLPNVLIEQLNPATFCIDAAPVALTGSTPTGGVYSGSGITDTTFTPSSLAAGGPYTITYTFTDGHGCTNSSSENLTVAPLPTVTSTPANKVICSGNPLTITAYGALTYSWAPTTDLTVGGINDSLATADPTTPTFYTLTGTDTNGCVNTDTFTVHIGVLPHPAFAMNIPNQCAPLDAQFINFDTVSKTAYLWNFGDGTTSNLQSPQHNYAMGDTFRVKLTEINAVGCIDSVDTTEKLVSLLETAVLPNAFTPGDKEDAQNGLFGPQVICNNVTGFVFRIYNRWGQLIFSANSPTDQGWDGTYLGKPEPLGVYVYYLNFTCGTCPINRKGNITLLR